MYISSANIKNKTDINHIFIGDITGAAMAPRKRIFKEDILEASIRVIKKQGAASLTVRNIAAELECSTQPIYSEFKNLNCLKDELYKYAAEKYLRFCFSNYKEYAIAFLTFAKKEKELFKFLYLRRRGSEEKLPDDVNYAVTVELLSRNLEMEPERAEQMHHWMQYYCYTMGVMIATDYRDLSPMEMHRELTELYSIMLRHYKEVKSEDELQYWLNKSRNLII